MTYIVNWSNPGNIPPAKPAIEIPPLSKDSTSTSLTLTGKGLAQYGQIQQENFIRLLENFSSPTAPLHPTVGQIWFKTTDNTAYICVETDPLDINPATWQTLGGVFKGDEAPAVPNVGDTWWDFTNGVLNIFNGSVWHQIWPSLSKTPVAFVEEYNAWVDIYNQVAGTPTGTTYATAFGYGQTPLTYAVIEDMTNEKWVALLAKFKSVARHQGTSFAGLSSRGFILGPDSPQGVVTALSEYNQSLIVANNTVTAHNSTNPLSLENAILANSSYVRNYSYYNAKNHEVSFTFDSLNHAKAFFNSGGNFKINASFAASTSTSFTNAWTSFISSIGQITFGANATTKITVGPASPGPGFYGLVVNGVAVQIFNSVSTISGSVGAYYKITASLIQNVSTGELTVKFVITFAPDGMHTVYAGSGSGTDSAIGATTSSITTYKASSLYLNTPTLSFPSVVQTGTFVTDSTI